MDTPSLLSAVDTCVLLDLVEHSHPAWQAIRRLRAHGVHFTVPPEVTHELVFAAKDYADTEHQRSANISVQTVGRPPLHDFLLGNLDDWQLDAALASARRLRRESLLPHEEWHDHLIICESALLGCEYLLTNDTHLLGVPQQRLAAVLQQTGLTAPRIISYHSILA